MKETTELIGKTIGIFCMGFGALAIIALVMGLPTKWLWNYLVTDEVTMAIFGVTHLTFWKAFWLNVLCGILFKKGSSVSTSKS